jgi:hypothetical protein
MVEACALAQELGDPIVADGGQNDADGNDATHREQADDSETHDRFTRRRQSQVAKDRQGKDEVEPGAAREAQEHCEHEKGGDRQRNDHSAQPAIERDVEHVDQRNDDWAGSAAAGAGASAMTSTGSTLVSMLKSSMPAISPCAQPPRKTAAAVTSVARRMDMGQEPERMGFDACSMHGPSS